MASFAMINFLLFALSVFIAVGDSQISFVSTPPAGPNSVYDNDPVFVLGSILNIQWTSETSDFISLVMYQQRPNDTFEYIFREFPSPCAFSIHDAKNGAYRKCRRPHVLYVDHWNSKKSLRVERLLFRNFYQRTTLTLSD